MVETSFGGDVGKRAVSVVVIQSVAVNARYEEIRVAVVIVIADSRTDIEACSGEPGRVCDICKFAVAIIPEEPIAVFGRVFVQCCEVGPVGEENVGATVVVVVKNGDSADHAFGRVAGRRFVVFKSKRDRLEREVDGTCTRGREQQCGDSQCSKAG